jgi:hypothetical protein
MRTSSNLGLRLCLALAIPSGACSSATSAPSGTDAGRDGGSVAGNDASAVTDGGGGSDAGVDRDAGPIADAGRSSDPDAALALDCAAVRDACEETSESDSPRFTRAFASGLGALEGAPVRFAVRYLLTLGSGLDTPRGVVTASTTVEGGEFEACVCVPRNGNNYPEIAAAVFAVGSNAERGSEVELGYLTQAFGVAVEQDLSSDLAAVDEVDAELVVAAMTERTEEIHLSGLEGELDDVTLWAGIIAPERPLAARLVRTEAGSAEADLLFSMPGFAWPDEELVVIFDRDDDGSCGEGDVAYGFPDLAGRTELDAGEGLRVEGATDLGPPCAALRVDLPH